jgi:hypothetical protein
MNHLAGTRIQGSRFALALATAFANGLQTFSSPIICRVPASGKGVLQTELQTNHTARNEMGDHISSFLGVQVSEL